MLKTLVFVRAGLSESVTFIVKPYVPAVVGVPDITPVTGLRVSPDGKLPASIDHV